MFGVREMAREERDRIVTLFLFLREQVPVVRARFSEWIEQAREEPQLIWSTPAVRYISYAVAAMILAGVTLVLANAIAPPLQPHARPLATTVDFHVVCAHEQCGYHFVLHGDMGFGDFPVVCPKCQHRMGQRALRCNSQHCQGRWVAPNEVDGMFKCPRCGEALGK
ncbi:MAG: hypothetical protein ACE5HE_06910 [Phycisphaerae bacterium]